MVSSGLAPSPQTTIMPLQPKRKPCSSTLPPLQLLLSLLSPQTSYTHAGASSLSFSSAPTGIWLWILSPKPQPLRQSHQTQGPLLQLLNLSPSPCSVSHNGHPLLLEIFASSSQGPPRPTPCSPLPHHGLGGNNPLSSMTGGPVSSALSQMTSSRPFHNHLAMV